MDRWENIVNYNVLRFTGSDYLNYDDLNHIEDLVEELATLYERNYTKKTWVMNQDRIEDFDFQNIENELDYYNNLYYLNYKKKNWTSSIPLYKTISYKDINKWLDEIYYGFNLYDATKVSRKVGTFRASNEIKQINLIEEE